MKKNENWRYVHQENINYLKMIAIFIIFLLSIENINPILYFKHPAMTSYRDIVFNNNSQRIPSVNILSNHANCEEKHVRNKINTVVNYYSTSFTESDKLNLTLRLCCEQNSTVTVSIPWRGHKNEISINKYCFIESNNYNEHGYYNVIVEADEIRKILKRLLDYYSKYVKANEYSLDIFLRRGSMCGRKLHNNETELVLCKDNM